MRASLRATYGIDLRTVRGSIGCLDLADLVAWLPVGCPLWMSVGGPASIPREVAQMQRVEYLLRVLVRQNAGKGEWPKPPEAPKYAREAEVKESADQRKAEAYRRRSKLRDGGLDGGA